MSAGRSAGPERPAGELRLADYPVPRLRQALVTGAVLATGAGVFLYMVADVLVALVAGVVLGAYLLPLHRRLVRLLRRPRLAAVATILAAAVPLAVVLAYGWVEIAEAARYLEANRRAIAVRLAHRLAGLPWLEAPRLEEAVARWIERAAASSALVVDEIQEGIELLVLSVALAIVTIYFVLVDHRRVATYLAERVPARYRAAAERLTGNVRAVVYGALYATFLTQVLKAAVVLAMNLAWHVPLAVVLAIAAFFIGFLPIVGSWTIYIPAGLYLIVWRGDLAGGLALMGIGLVVVTLFLSLYLRPKLAAEKSRVLTFYWMFLALVTGVYAFGIIGIVVGPVVVGVLKAALDSLGPGAEPGAWAGHAAPRRVAGGG